MPRTAQEALLDWGEPDSAKRHLMVAGLRVQCFRAGLRVTDNDVKNMHEAPTDVLDNLEALIKSWR